jgi:hypothetical protein
MESPVEITSSSRAHGYFSYGPSGGGGGLVLNLSMISASPSELSVAPSGQTFLQWDGCSCMRAGYGIPSSWTALVATKRAAISDSLFILYYKYIRFYKKQSLIF